MTDRSERPWRFIAGAVAMFLVLAWTQAGSWGVAHGQTAPGKETPAMPVAATPASFPTSRPASPSAPTTESPVATAQGVNAGAALRASSQTPTLMPILIGAPTPIGSSTPNTVVSGRTTIPADETPIVGAPDRTRQPSAALVGDALVGLGAVVIVVTAIRRVVRR